MNLKGIISFIIGCSTLLVCLFLKEGEIRGTLVKIALGFVLGGAIEFIALLYENRKRWKILKTLVYKKNQPVRVTIAYLFRIEVNGKYVLIKRHKKDSPGYQPVGGTYKYLKEENRELFDKLGVEPCNLVPRDEDTEDDLRITIRKRKHLIAFLKWFESRKNREIDPYREFCEELVEPGLLPADLFKHIKYVFIGKHVEGVLKSPVFAGDELRYADIFELRPENDLQKQAIKKLQDGGEEILFATPEEIRNRASRDGRIILPHTFKILTK